MQFDELARFPLVEPSGDPFRLRPFDAAAVEQVDRAVELKQDAAERFQLPGQCGADRKRSGGDVPIQAGEKPRGRESVVDEARAFGGVRFKGEGHGGD